MPAADTALLLIDMQRDFVLTDSPLRFAGAAATIPELAPIPRETVLIKPRFSAFFQTDLDWQLRGRGIDKLLIAGTQYPNCIRATVTDALSLDYLVTVISDCCSAQTPAVAEANITDMKNLGALCLTLEEWCRTRT